MSRFAEFLGQVLHRSIPCLLLGLVLLTTSAESANTSIQTSSSLQELVSSVAATTLTHFADKQLHSDQLGLTLIDLRNPAQPVQASFRGGVPIYPASVVKLFYLAAAHRWLEDRQLQETEELRRALRDMIFDSCNEATHYVIDLLTGTTSGPELSVEEMKVWSEKRNRVNRYFAGLGYLSINVNQKPWNEGPYGRERVFVGANYENRNALTTDATARLLANIALGREVSPERSTAMLKLLQREPFKPNNADSQATAYTGGGLPAGSELWSKAGWTSTARHDAALVKLPDGRRFVLVTFTTGHSRDKEIIPFITKHVVTRLPN